MSNSLQHHELWPARLLYPWNSLGKNTGVSSLLNCSVVSNSSRPHGQQHTRNPCSHHLPELTHTNVHRVSNAIRQFHVLLSPSPAFNLSQHQGLFKWVSSSHQVAQVFEFQLQHQSFHIHSGLISFRMDWLDLLAVHGTLKSLKTLFSNTTVQKHQFFSIQLSLYSNSHIHTWPLVEP